MKDEHRPCAGAGARGDGLRRVPRSVARRAMIAPDPEAEWFATYEAHCIVELEALRLSAFAGLTTRAAPVPGVDRAHR